MFPFPIAFILEALHTAVFLGFLIYPELVEYKYHTKQ